MPYPETGLYKQLEAEGRLLYSGKWWLSPDFKFGKSAFKPHNMTADELEIGCYNARKEYYRIGSIMRRALDFNTNMRSLSNFGYYNLENYLSYNDALKKQDIMLGLE